MPKKQDSRIDGIYTKLKESQYRCALTGWKLDVDNWELDHIQAMQDGGNDEVDNLQCVHPLVNQAKGSMGNVQFIDMCRQVADYNPEQRP